MKHSATRRNGVHTPRTGSVQGIKLAFSIREACQALGVSRSTLWRWRQSGVLRAVEVQGRVLIPAAEIRRLLLGD